MRVKRHFIIRGGDFKPEKQQEIVRDIIEGLEKDYPEQLKELMLEIASDPYDMGRVEPTDAYDYIVGMVTGAVERSCYSWEVEVKI